MQRKIPILCLALLALSSCLTSQTQSKETTELDAEESIALDEERTQITVKTDIPKSSVFLNDIFQGVTNITLNDLREGTYVLRVEKSGFKTEQHTILIEKGEAKTFFLALEKE